MSDLFLWRFARVHTPLVTRTRNSKRVHVAR